MLFSWAPAFSFQRFFPPNPEKKQKNVNICIIGNEDNSYNETLKNLTAYEQFD